MAKEMENLDVWIAQYVLKHEMVFQKKGTVKEKDKFGQIRPLRRYSKDIAAAWEVAQALGITLIPIKDGSWFALVGKGEGWDSPAELIEHLQAGDFVNSGAAVTDNPAMSICLAALRSIEKREGLAFSGIFAESPASTNIQ